MENVMQQIAIWALPVLFAITVHEAAHGWMAKRLGDPTAMMLGRLSLNPIKHIDPMGTVVIPLVLLTLGGFIFGYAKPVPITWENLRNPKRDMVYVALAGPAANLLMALAWAALLKICLLLFPLSPWMALPLASMAEAGILINVVLMVLNLLPLPPLDGGRVLSGLLPDRLAWRLNQLEPYGFIILLAMLMTGVLGQLIGPPIAALQSLLLSLAH